MQFYQHQKVFFRYIKWLKFSTIQSLFFFSSRSDGGKKYRDRSWKSLSKVQHSPRIFSRCSDHHIGRCLGFWAWGRVAKERAWKFLPRCARRLELSSRLSRFDSPSKTLFFSAPPQEQTSGAQKKDYLVLCFKSRHAHYKDSVATVSCWIEKICKGLPWCTCSLNLITINIIL